MSNDKQSSNLAIVGAGRHGMSILEDLVPPRKRGQPLKVVGVADVNPESSGLIYAYRHNLFVTCDFLDLLRLPEVDIIVNTTGRPEISHQLREQGSEKLTVLNLDRPLIFWEDFWDLIPVDFSPLKDDSPLKLGIVGGGKAGHEIIRHFTGEPRFKRTIEIIGVADRNPRAKGMLLAKKVGISTFGNYLPLLGTNPDLILELTGDPQVRREILEKRHPNTQIIDHVKARLFWELLVIDEDRLRNKVASELKLAGQRSRFHKIFDHLPDPVLVVKPDYEVQEVNSPFLQRFQKNGEEVIGKPCYQVIRPLKEHGAEKVVAFCTHPVLSGPAVERIQNSHLDELVVTDTIPLRDDARACSKIRQLSIAGLMAETIRRISNEDSVSSLFIE